MDTSGLDEDPWNNFISWHGGDEVAIMDADIQNYRDLGAASFNYLA
jgi:hypothetical protein